MKKIFTLLCGAVLAAHCSQVSAQNAKVEMWKDGSVAFSYAPAEADSVTFGYEYESPEENVYLVNGHRFIDLGLPSGTLWAETNIGAEGAADDGEYFAWGETEVQSDGTYLWESYRFGSSTLSKYNRTDNKVNLDRDDDAAAAVWGAPCQTPSNNDINELLNSNNCTWKWSSKTSSTLKSVRGYLVTSKKNGMSIFFPALGYRYNSKTNYKGSYGSYWSRTLDAVGSYNSFYLGFGSTSYGLSSGSRCDGHTIRPVARH